MIWDSSRLFLVMEYMDLDFAEFMASQNNQLGLDKIRVRSSVPARRLLLAGCYVSRTGACILAAGSAQRSTAKWQSSSRHRDSSYVQASCAVTASRAAHVSAAHSMSCDVLRASSAQADAALPCCAALRAPAADKALLLPQARLLQHLH